MPRTIRQTVGRALHIPADAIAVTSGLNDVITALEEREAEVVSRIEEALGEDEGRVVDLLTNDGYR